VVKEESKMKSVIKATKSEMYKLVLEYAFNLVPGLKADEIIAEEECEYINADGDFWLFFATDNNVYKAVLLAIVGTPYFGIKDVDTKEDWIMRVDPELLINNGMVSECA